MATTAMNFTLGPAMLSKVTSGGGGNGVYVYAFAFGNGRLLGSTTLVNSGVVTATQSLQLANNSTVSAGNVIIVTQQAGAGQPSNLPSQVHAIGDLINTGNATRSNYRYDAIEFTLLNSGADVANLTNIVQFGEPMSLSITYSNGTTATRGYAVSGQTIVNDLKGISPAGSQNYPWSPATPFNDQRETLGLANNVVPNPLNVASDWTNYVTGFKGIAGQVYLAAYFNGPPASLSLYSVVWDGAQSAFWLNPVHLGNNVATTNYSLKIPFTALTQNIYTQTGSLDVYTAMNGSLYKHFDSFTPNNAWGQIASVLVSGFDAGMWGGSANSINPKVTGTINLNQTWNWTADYTYAAINAPAGKFGYTNSIGTGTGYYDRFAAEFVKNSNSYGYSYSDLLSHGGGINPAISVWDTAANRNVSAINVKLFDLSDAPSGYTQPSLNYVAPSPPATDYKPANTQSSDQFLFDFALSPNYFPAAGVPVTFRFYAPGDPRAQNGFVSLPLPTGGSQTSDYEQSFTVSGGPGNWSLTPGGFSGQRGFLLIANVPVTSDGSTGWYQMTIGTGSSAKTYNMYIQSNPASPTSNITSAVVDGGAMAQRITGQANQVKFSFDANGAVTYSPFLFASPRGDSGSDSGPPPPTLTAPRVGNVASDGTFDPSPNVGNVKQGDLAFSWSPAGDTNKIIPGNFVELVLASSTHPDWILAPLVTQADDEGEWLTTLASAFGNGQYRAFLEQFTPDDPLLQTAVYATSVPVDFTVALDDLKLVAVDGGSALRLDAGGSTTKGNWIEVHALHSSLSNGTLLAYATDAAGNLVARDGHTGPDVMLSDAVLGRFGLVADDTGGLLFAGHQAFYLRADQQLHFAIAGAGAGGASAQGADMAMTGATTMGAATGAGTLGVTVSGAGGSVQFTAEVNNNLSGNDALASAQRFSDQPWVYLTEGARVHVDVAGSADNVNAAHFVRIDVDQGTGAWSVGGVDYGNTDAFRDAVRANWDQGFALQDGHGTFHDEQSWTVAGQSGFYAPVLATQDGGLFVIGNANVDGLEHIRTFGANTFGFEDLRADQHSDFDYNDMVVKLTIGDSR